MIPRGSGGRDREWRASSGLTAAPVGGGPRRRKRHNCDAPLRRSTESHETETRTNSNIMVISKFLSSVVVGLLLATAGASAHKHHHHHLPVMHDFAKAGVAISAAEALGGAAATAVGAASHNKAIQHVGEAAMGVGTATGLASAGVADFSHGHSHKHGRKLLHWHLPCKKFLGCHPVEKGFARAGQAIGAAEALGGAAATAYGAYNHNQAWTNGGEAAMGLGAATGLGSTAGYRYAEGPFQRGINDMKSVTGLGRKLLQN